MTNILIDTLSETGTIIFFDEKRNIISQKNIEIIGKESKKLGEIFFEFLKENNLNLENIKNIVCTIGPGSFTGIRVTTLFVNTLAFAKNIPLTGITFFDLYEEFPKIKKSSKMDSFIQKSENSKIEIIKNVEIEEFLKLNNISKIYGDFETNLENIYFEKSPNYAKIIKEINFENKEILEALYIKAPSIN